MSAKAAQRLLDLEAAGFVFSRNRNFDGYADPKNQAALTLKKRLASLQSVVRDHSDELNVRVERCGLHYMVHLSLPRVSARYMAKMSETEIAIFARDGIVARVLRDAGWEKSA